MSIPVTLNWHEVSQAAWVGIQRQIGALVQAKPDSHGFQGDGWGVHIEGAAGEMALAKVLDVYWSGSVNTYKKGGDVGNIQVRTRSEDHYDLLIRSNDRDEDIFYLVTGRIPNFKVVGWIRAGDAKRPEFLKTHGNRPPAYFIPQRVLHPADTSPRP